MSFVTQEIKLPPADKHPMFYVGVFAAIGIGSRLVFLLTLVVQYVADLRASKMFRQLLDAVVHATMRWFDTTPQGCLLNRFSNVRYRRSSFTTPRLSSFQDIETINSSLAGTLKYVNNSLATFFSSILVVTYVQRRFGTALYSHITQCHLPILSRPCRHHWLYVSTLAVGYLNTGRDLRRMESNSRFPILSGFNEILEGVITVRDFSAEQRFINNVHVKIDLAF